MALFAVIPETGTALWYFYLLAVPGCYLVFCLGVYGCYWAVRLLRRRGGRHGTEEVKPSRFDPRPPSSPKPDPATRPANPDRNSGV